MKSREKETDQDWWKKLTSSNSYKRNLDTMKLLEGREDFQRIVLLARSRLHVPDGGLSDKPKEVSEAWGKAYEKEVFDIFDSPALAKQEIAIKEKIINKERSRRMGTKLLNLLYDKVPSNYLSNCADFIIDKFNLPLHFKECIKVYIVQG